MATDDMVALVPQLRSIARSLCRDGARADDLVQEALLRAFDNLRRCTPGQRTALILVSASGTSYEEAAEACGCAVGTIKSARRAQQHAAALTRGPAAARRPARRRL